MRAWDLRNVNLGVIVAALLLPGGFLILAWAVYRRCFPRATDIVKRLVPLAILAALLQGCATQLVVVTGPGAAGADAAATRQALRFQSPDVAPRNAGASLTPGELQPGDIILTAGTSLVASSIQLVTFTPVSHAAIYIGGGMVVEALRPKVRVVTLREALAGETMALVLRYPGLTADQARSIGDFALQKAGTGFNFLAVTLHVPYAVSRRMCELPMVPSAVRDACIRSFGLMHYAAASENRMFCSQLVLSAYRQAGVPITDADPRLISPADILHMREGDVSSVKIHKQLRYVGHLMYQEPVTVAELSR